MSEPSPPLTIATPPSLAPHFRWAPPLSLGSLLRRPKTGPFPGLVAVFAFFTLFGGTNFASPTGAASWLNGAASLGIIAIPIGLLMIA